MIVHFGGSVRGTGDDLPYMRCIIRAINEFGSDIALNWIENSTHKAAKHGKRNFKIDWGEVVQGNDNALLRADVFIAEITSYRLYHGYEIANALAMSKPVLLVARSPFEEFAISGVRNPLLVMHEYTNEEQLAATVKAFLQKNSVPDELKKVEIAVSPMSSRAIRRIAEQSGNSIEEVAQDLISHEASTRLSREAA